MQVLHCLPDEEIPGWLGAPNDLRDLMIDSQLGLTSWAGDSTDTGSAAPLATSDEDSELLLWAMDHEILTGDERLCSTKPPSVRRPQPEPCSRT